MACSIEAFAASSFVTTSAWPFSQATNSGVGTLLSAWFTTAFVDQSHDNLGVTQVARTAQRRDAIVVGLIHVGVRSGQLRDDLGVAVLAGDDQRRGAFVVGVVRPGVRSEQLRDDLGVALLTGD